MLLERLWYLRCHEVGEQASSSSNQNIALKCNEHKTIKENDKKIESSSNSSEERDEDDDCWHLLARSPSIEVSSPSPVTAPEMPVGIS